MSSNTEWGDYLFTVKEFGDGTPWLMAELREGNDLSILENGFLGFTLRSGTTYEEAQGLARHLHKVLDKISYTRP